MFLQRNIARMQETQDMPAEHQLFTLLPLQQFVR
jgi:hypothetical protein